MSSKCYIISTTDDYGNKELIRGFVDLDKALKFKNEQQNRSDELRLLSNQFRLGLLEWERRNPRPSKDAPTKPKAKHFSGMSHCDQLLNDAMKVYREEYKDYIYNKNTYDTRLRDFKERFVFDLTQKYSLEEINSQPYTSLQYYLDEVPLEDA